MLPTNLSGGGGVARSLSSSPFGTFGIFVVTAGAGTPFASETRSVLESDLEDRSPGTQPTTATVQTIEMITTMLKTSFMNLFRSYEEKLGRRS